MNDNEIANKLIKWIESIKSWTIRDEKVARQLALAELSEIKTRYGWKAMKKAYNERSCTSITNFKRLCQQHKELMEKQAIKLH